LKAHLSSTRKAHHQLSSPDDDPTHLAVLRLIRDRRRRTESSSVMPSPLPQLASLCRARLVLVPALLLLPSMAHGYAP